MVKFKESGGQKITNLFVDEDPARIYRELKDLLVEEFDMDRVEHVERQEFNVSKPKDRIRLYAFKEKSPNTVIRLKLSLDAKPPGKLERLERPEDVLKAKIKITGNVISVYPGRNEIPWEPEGFRERTHRNWGKAGLSDEKSSFHKSKIYEILVGIWYNKIYSKEIEKYEEEAEEMVVHIDNIMRQKFGVSKSIHRSGGGAYKPPWE